MKEEFAQLQGINSQLQNKLESVASDHTSFQSSMGVLESENVALKTKIDNLTDTVQSLQESELKVNELLSEVSKKVNDSNDSQLKDQISQLEQLQTDTKREIAAIGNRLAELESNFKQAPTAGIFSYIKEESDQALFIEKIEEALILEMTYAQIDEHLTESLPPELDGIIKDHPSLTKNYIRNVRRD